MGDILNPNMPLTELIPTNDNDVSLYEDLVTVSPSAELGTNTAWVFWAKVVKPFPVLILVTDYAYPEVPLNQGAVVTFEMNADVPTGPLLAYVDFHPAFPVQTNGSWGVTAGQMVAGVWYSLQFNGSYWVLLNPSTPQAETPEPLPSPEPLPAVTPPVNVSLLYGGYVIPEGGTAYGTFQNASNISLNISTDLVSQSVGLYQVVISSSASGSFQYVPTQATGTSSPVTLSQTAYTQEFTISIANDLIDSHSLGTSSTITALGNLIPPEVCSGTFAVRRLI